MLAFAAGAFTAIADSTTWPGLYAVFRDGIIEMVPVIVALKVIFRPGKVPPQLQNGGQMSGGPVSGGPERPKKSH